MGTAKREREMAAKGEGCLGKAADDEPVFVLRAKDKFAPQLVYLWTRLASAAELDLVLKVPGTQFDRARIAKISEAAELVVAMRNWQVVNGSKIPD